MTFKKVFTVQRVTLVLALLICMSATLFPMPADARHDQALSESQIVAGKFDLGLFNKVMPLATSFGKPTGKPPSNAAYQNDVLIGYIFYSKAVVASAGYTGRPLNILIGLNLVGNITGVQIIEHHEPILEIGVSDKDLQNFIDQFVGLDIRKPVKIIRHAKPGQDEFDAISGASVLLLF